MVSSLLDRPGNAAHRSHSHQETLREIPYDNTKHFRKQSRTKRELEVLKAAARANTEYIVELLGVNNGMLVFRRYQSDLLEHVILHDDASAKNVCKWTVDITFGLDFLHSNGYIHKDLSLKNVLYSDPIKICDLECGPWSVPGSAPEVISDKRFSVKSDVYSLALCIFQMQHPKYTLFDQLILEPPFCQLGRLCTQEDPDKRPQTAQIREFLNSIVLTLGNTVNRSSLL